MIDRETVIRPLEEPHAMNEATGVTVPELPPLPPIEMKRHKPTEVFAYAQAYARAAVLAERKSPPAVLFDGFAVLQALDARAKTRTSAENVSDVLDAVVRLIREGV